MFNLEKVLMDTVNFCNFLQTNYGIRFISRNSFSSYMYEGEYINMSGLYYKIIIQVLKGKTDIKIFNSDRRCLMHKNYNTTNDYNALSKSTSLVKYIEKHR